MHVIWHSILFFSIQDAISYFDQAKRHFENSCIH